jgi:hypothetical protein
VTARKKAAPSDNDGTESLRQQALRLYKEGHKVEDIRAQTGVPKATLYWLLQKEGITPDRTQAPDVMTMEQLLKLYNEAQNEIGHQRTVIAELMAENRELVVIAKLLKRLGIDPNDTTVGTMKASVRKLPSRPRKV